MPPDVASLPHRDLGRVIGAIDHEHPGYRGAGLQRLVHGRLVASPGLQVTVDAVVAGVYLGADEPLRIRRVPLQDRVPGLEPVDELGLLSPEALRILVGSLVDARIAPVRLCLELVRRRIAAVLLQEGVDGAVDSALTGLRLRGCHSCMHLRTRMVSLARADPAVL